MKQLSLITIGFILFFGSGFAQDKEFMKKDFSLADYTNDSTAIYYRIKSEKNAKIYTIYNLEDAALGKEETEEDQDGILIRNILLVNPDLSPKEAHLIEERKYQTMRQSRIYNDSGKLLHEEKYRNGLLQSRAHYDEKGKIKSEDEIVLASPKGGLQAWNDHVVQNLKYPSNAKQTGAQGTVYVNFDVDEKGKTSNYKVLRTEGLHPELIKEAIRVISIYRSGWVPYSANGIKEASQVTLPIRFKLS